jgi:hypothetical protein
MPVDQPNFIQNDHQIDFDGMRFPLILSNQESLSTLTSTLDWLKSQQVLLESALRASGALLFRGFPIDSAEAFDTFSAAFGYDDFTYEQSLSNAVRINHTRRIFTANEAPPAMEIFLHHEMAQTPVSPSKLFFYCHAAAHEGGATSLCRSDKLYERLLAEQPEWAARFEAHGLRYTTVMPVADNPGSGQGRSWQSTLDAADQSAAETRLMRLGYTWAWQADGGLQATTPVLPAVVNLDDGRKVFYNQLLAAYAGWAGVKDNPDSALLLGDGSSIPVAIFEQLLGWAHQLTFDLCWQAGDVVLLDNYCTMHGRRPYAGAQLRQVLVALAA